ncbi:MAG: PilN domain-containing protein [Ahniella sp.]|nr:PilN domain-containing protein [Ahniella sp.]
MAKINLLPWRAERRKQREREFQVMMVGALIIGGLAFLVALGWMDRVVQGHQNRKDLLTREISALDVKIKEIEVLQEKRETLLRRKEIIERLQSSRYQMVHVFDELVRTLPDGVRLTEMSQSGEALNLIGNAQSNARISAYMRNIETAGWLRLPDFRKSEIISDEKSGRYRFELGVGLRKSEDEDEETSDGETVEGASTSTTGGAQ